MNISHIFVSIHYGSVISLLCENAESCGIPFSFEAMRMKGIVV